MKKKKDLKSRRLNVAVQPAFLELIHRAAYAAGWGSTSEWIRHVLMAAAKTALEKEVSQ